FSTAPGRFLELLFPHVYGYHRGSGPYFWGLASHGSAPYFLSIYLGLAVAIGAIAAIYVRPRDAIAALAFCGFWYAIALGRNTVLFESLYDAGLATAFRYPEKFLAIIILPLVVLGGLVLDEAIRGARRATRSVMVTAAIIATAGATIWLVSYSSSYARWFVAHWKLPPAADPPSLIALSQRSWLTAALYGAVLLVLFAFRPRLPDRLFGTALLLFTAADLMRVMPDVRLTAPAAFFQKPGIVGAIGNDVQKPIFHIGDWFADTTDATRYSRLGDRYYWVARNAILPPIGAAFGVATVLERDYDETYLRPTRELLRAMMIRNRMGGTSWWEPFAELAGAAYVLDYRDYETVASECGGDFALSRPVRIGRARDPLPRYYFASHLVASGRADALAQSLLARRFSQRTAFIDGEPFAPAPARVLRASESPARAEVEVEAEGRSLLVMNVTPHRYWKVTVDGKEVIPLRVNLAYQGVVVERGRHLVEMRYRNPLVIAGGVVSLLAVIVAGAAGWLTRS
ncbi:MAG TPA: hypothetical protein VFL80_00250, partial [Thermoanaerobaculia bacterium]|nr:hypothetical protein [Thermoanaerobaculia bacterium]